MLRDGPLWRRTPPAIFPVCLGFLGLGLGWRNAANVLPIAHEIGDLILGGSSAFFVFFLASYCLKLVARPGVIFEDMVTAPARAGLSAAAMSMMLLAAALLPLGVSAPQIWWCGVILQIGASAVGCYAIWREAPEKRAFSPFQYLIFVGPVVGPVAGIPLGYIWQSIALTMAALVAYVIITTGWLGSLSERFPPMPMRPSIVIFLAPNCLFAISFGLLDFVAPFYLFYWLSNVIAAVFLVATPWIVRRPWTPVWASLTFPLAAFVQLQVLGVSKGLGVVAEVALVGAMVLATPVVLGIVYRSILAWVTGELSEKSQAALA